MPIVTFYLLRDWDVLVARVNVLLPKDHAEIIRGRMSEIDQTLSAFVRGQAMVCLVMGVYYGVALSVADVGLGLVIGLMSGVLTFVPYLGMLSGVTLAMGMAFAQTGDWTLPLIVAGIFLAGNLVENNYLVPKLVGDRIGLHPLWVIFALMAGGALAGMVGLLLAVPVAAIAGVILRYVISRYLESPLYYGNGQS
jgi:predicted PurR-regulated permease PerM